ncbi:MAG: polyphosphate kinase 1, partial [Bacteroidia bacterium]
KYEAYTIKLTRDAELALDDDISESFLQKISKSLKQRKRGRPIRFIYDDEMPLEMLRMLLRKLGLRKGDNVIPGARYHNFKDFIKFPKIGSADLRYSDVPPLPHRHIGHNQSIFSAMRKRDILLHYPYQSFHYVIDFLREASIDPLVTSIKITLYRISQTSNVANALINAVKNGKQVTVLLELQARFDEENNIYWANRLREEGAKVIFGVPSVKVHAKICLITRKERAASVRYAYIGTGNFNEDTSRLYSDHGLFTRHKLICQELNQVFTFLENNFKTSNYKNILVSPYHMRNAFYNLIAQETAFAKQGKKAYMILKMNSLVDPDMIERLYEASQAGVKIQLIIRGICSLKPGVKGVSENIEAISIVDKYLEHSRIFVFGNGGAEKMFFGSADWMSRNLDQRIEVDCPVYDKTIQKELKTFLQIQWADNTKARILDKSQHNAYKQPAENASVRAQVAFYEHLKSISSKPETTVPEPETETKPAEKVVKKTISTAKIIIR